MRLLDNLTVKASWFLVLLFFGSMNILLSGLGLYALQQGGVAVTAMAPHAGESGAAYLAAFDTTERLIRWGIVAVLIGSVMVMAVVVWGISVNVLQPLARLVGYFEGLAKGDLAQPVEQRGNNEIGRLFTSLKNMQDGLSDTVGTVRSSSEGIYSDAHDIAEGNGELSARTEQQAASLAETASSMEELAATVEQNADNARQASQLAAEATQTAQQGGEVVGEVVATMHDISESSHKMSDIIGAIDSIAFQTNILALNASVEAARAGEHGRGFAVVAQEVRSLAGRSASAAGEIRELIQASLEKVNVGTARVDKAGQTMGEIVAAVQRVSDIMDEIASASQEQSHGIGQVNLAVTQMDEVTQQNAALVEQAATAANQLEAEAARLREAVLRFHLAGQAGKRETARSHHAIEHKALPTSQSHDPLPAPAGSATIAPQAPNFNQMASVRQTTSTQEEEWTSF